MEFVPTAAMALLIMSIINLVKYVRVGDVNGIVTTVSVWVAGVVVVLLAAQTDFAEGIVIADQALSALNTWSLIFIGLTISSIAQFANDIRASIDGSDSSVKPDLVSGNAHVTAVRDAGLSLIETIVLVVVVVLAIFGLVYFFG